jgi:hypothetical protein
MLFMSNDIATRSLFPITGDRVLTPDGMSYDLFFKPSPQLTNDRFMAFFAGREGYELQGSQAWYANQDTGVYFSFGWNEPSEHDELGDDEDPHAASFNLNYMRPPFFALEAEPEVRAFVEHFGPEILDPQTEGMGEGPYSAEGFLRGWNAGNQFGVRVMVSQQGADVNPTLPEAELMRIWRWNSQRQSLQQELGEAVFVPQISLVELEGHARSFVVWGDAIPITLPRVDLVVIPREELAPRRLLLRRPDMMLALWNEVDALLPELVHEPSAQPEYWVLGPSAKPLAAIVQWVRSQTRDASAILDKGLSMDEVLPTEWLVESEN